MALHTSWQAHRRSACSRTKADALTSLAHLTWLDIYTYMVIYIYIYIYIYISIYIYTYSERWRARFMFTRCASRRPFRVRSVLTIQKSPKYRVTSNSVGNFCSKLWAQRARFSSQGTRFWSPEHVNYEVLGAGYRVLAPRTRELLGFGCWVWGLRAWGTQITRFWVQGTRF